MIQRFSTNFGVFSFFIDLGISLGSLFLSKWIRPFLSSISLFQPITEKYNIPILIYILFPLIWVSFLFFFSVYDGKMNLKVIDEFTNLTLASMLATISLAGLLFFTYRDISRGFFTLDVILTFLFLIFWRVAARGLYKRRIEVKGYKIRILIAGAGPVGLNFKEKLVNLSKVPFTFIGFLDDSIEKQKNNIEIIDSISQIRKWVQTKHIDHVIIALPQSAHERVKFIINQLVDLPVRISVIPDYFHFTIKRMAVSEFADIPILDIRSPALSENQRLTKRVFDIVIVSILLILAIPLMALISLLILIFDRAPILFRQNRVGENGRIIKIFKFRTMYVNSEKIFSQILNTDPSGKGIYKKPNDPRITPLGRILRRFSLDELPQLFNVMRGTLSLVGPRPELPTIVEKYEPWQRARLSVPQGLTGWWQTQGRSDKPLHLNTEVDLYYIDNYSIGLDFWIVVKTIWIILRGKGAY